MTTANQTPAITCPTHPETPMTVQASWAFQQSARRAGRGLSIDVGFDGLPPDDTWDVHTVRLGCPTCEETVELYV
ncbi:MAG: hypothetical protein HYR48_08610 [Gemmatimonadetes bacterium]|nr:hypothetical protein [Gemmatimonadota bacterium]